MIEHKSISVFNESLGHPTYQRASEEKHNYRKDVTLSRGCSESVVLPLPNEAMLPRSIFSRLPSSDAVSSNSLRIKVENFSKILHI